MSFSYLAYQFGGKEKTRRTTESDYILLRYLRCTVIEYLLFQGDPTCWFNISYSPENSGKQVERSIVTNSTVRKHLRFLKRNKKE